MNTPWGSLKRRLGHLAIRVARQCDRLNSAGRTGLKHSPSSARLHLAEETTQWLEQNRLERMDATVDVFDPKRREFHLDRYRFAAKRVQGRQVLDCACGTGYGVRLLREQGLAARVIGVDIAAASIKYAWKHHGVSSAMYLCASGDRLPLVDASVDLVTSFETIEHVSNDGFLVNEFYRVLRPNGKLIVSTPNQWPLENTPFHVREYDRNSFVAVIESRFDCLELYNQNSGSDTPLNHGQTRGIVATTPKNEHLAECFIAVCQPKHFS